MEKYKLKFDNDGVEFVNLKIPKSFLNNFGNKIYSKIDFKNLFLSKRKFSNFKSHKGVNPRPGRNLAEKKMDTDFFFSNKNIDKKIE